LTNEPQIGGQKQRVLLMDDEDQIRFIGKEMLEYLGYDVLLSEDGEDAIKKIKAARNDNQPIDIVIMDLTIPGRLGGKEAISLIREFDLTIRAIVTSGYSNDPVMSNFAQYGFNGFLIKPFDIEMLAKALS
ncbi:MAG TPA: response regulator, partial [Candidatus Cloacimonadota bacterium]|nr:response regulator [Candidatus Cloacimonadota bacterium]